MNPSLWKIKNCDRDQQKILQDTLDISPTLARLLINRGVTTCEEATYFLNASWSDLMDPYGLDQMAQVCQRIRSAILNHERIVIYGDYDVDGITSTALLMMTLEYMGANVGYYLPDRIEEGYGINKEALISLKEKGTDLVISVDCGITAIEPAEVALKIGLDLIVTDHHECQNQLPNAYAIINPKKPSCQFREKHLAGAGIALKIAQALLDDKFEEIKGDLIQLAAVGTIADLAPLKGENRLIAKLGLQAVSQNPLPGLKALIDCSGIKTESLTAGHVGFQIGPRLNATGRLEQANIAVDLLLSKDTLFCTSVSSELNHLNQERQSIESQMIAYCTEAIEQEYPHSLPNVLILKDARFHVGVVGIAASRLVERYNRPVILLSEEEGILKGSGRSVGEFNLFKAIEATQAYLIHFGGHQQAAGLKMTRDNFELFKSCLMAYVDDNIQKTDLMKRVLIDGYLKSQEVTLDLVDELAALEPYGMGNSKPIFAMNQLTIEGVKWMGSDQNHLKLILNKEYRLFEALQFKSLFTDNQFKIHDSIDLAFTLEKNHFRNVETLQLHIKDLRLKTLDNLKDSALIQAYCASFLDYLSQSTIKPIQKSDLKKFVFYETVMNREDLAIEIGSVDSRKMVAFNLSTVISLYYHGNASATDWMVLLREGPQKQLLLCPRLEGLEMVIPDEWLLLDYPLDLEVLLWSSQQLLTIGYNPQTLRQQLAFLEHLSLERAQLADFYKRGLECFGHGSFDYGKWVHLFHDKILQALFALRVFIDGGALNTENGLYNFVQKVDKFNLYTLDLMKSMKIYGDNLRIAIEHCESNKLL